MLLIKMTCHIHYTLHSLDDATSLNVKMTASNEQSYVREENSQPQDVIMDDGDQIRLLCVSVFVHRDPAKY